MVPRKLQVPLAILLACAQLASVATHTGLGWKFVNRDLGLFILGFVTGFKPILHYMAGAQSGGLGPEFLKSVTLWWDCLRFWSR